MNSQIFIPARLQSSRFPNKLLQINPKTKKSVLQTTYETCKAVNRYTTILTDSQDIKDHIDSLGKQYQADCVYHIPDYEIFSGSDRIASWLMATDTQNKLVVNVQADEVGLTKETLEFFINRAYTFYSLDDVWFQTMIARNSTERRGKFVKAIPTKNKLFCQEFERTNVLHPSDHEHYGVYAYAPIFLELFHVHLYQSYNEKRYNLEQCRATDAGIFPRVHYSSELPFSINTEEDFSTWVENTNA